MTDATKYKFYFPAWNRCCRANRWRMFRGALEFDPERITNEGRRVLAFAKQRAVMEHRAIKLDDLRHGAHWLALGKDKSSAHLTNAEVDRVVCLFQVLADPDDLDARLKWDAYERGEDPGAVRRVEFVIKSIPDALARKISEDMIGTRMWEWATPEQKQILARRIAQYKQGRHGKAKSHNHVPMPGKMAAPTKSKPAPGGSYQLDLTKTFTPKPKAVTVPAEGDPNWNV